MYDHLVLNIDNLLCFGPKFENELVKELKSIDLLCDLEQDCPEQCDCKKRPADKTLIVNCSFSRLQIIPKLPSIPIHPISLEHVELFIHDNNLTELHSLNYIGFNNITVIMASNNKIRSIGSKIIPDSLKILDLKNNSLQFLDDVVIERFKRINKLYLSKNPWICNCNAITLLNFFNVFRHLIMDAENMTCEDGREFRILKLEDLCFQFIHFIVVLLIVITTISLCYLIYLKFQKQIKMWLYYHNCCLWWVSEEELDKDKDYDAFIVFSHFDD